MVPVLSLNDYSIFLSHINCLKDDFPKSDARFTNFYTRIAWSRDNYISPIPVCIALTMLTDGDNE